MLRELPVQTYHTDDSLNRLRFNPLSGTKLHDNLVVGREYAGAFEINPLDACPFPPVLLAISASKLEILALKEAAK